jgi:Zn finger protein HypA/HybF involved in hydrogenase expression
MSDFFNSPEFKRFSDSLEVAMKDAERAPDVDCPACGSPMVRVVGDRLTGYACHGFGCVGFHVSVEDLCNAENWAVLVNDAIARREAHEEMKRRNGAHHPPVPGDVWCGDCLGYHPPTVEHPSCSLCYSVHIPMLPDIHFNYRGWKFTPPFICMGCGIEVCFRQWAYSRSCGACDVSNSKTYRAPSSKCFAGAHELLPTWSAAEHDIPEDHFLDPKDRDKFPVRSH